MTRFYCFWRDLIRKDESSNPKHNDDHSVNIITLAKCGPQWINTAVYFRNKCKTRRQYSAVQCRRSAHQIVKTINKLLVMGWNKRKHDEQTWKELQPKFSSDNTLRENQWKLLKQWSQISPPYQTGEGSGR